jgi:hypothetical protein
MSILKISSKFSKVLNMFNFPLISNLSYNQISMAFVKSKSMVTNLVKGKSGPLHAMEALGGRECIAPTHSRPQH